MMTEDPEQLELTAGEDARDERRRDDLVAGILAGRDDTIERRVAIVLNRHPETRDSDIKLMLRYWELFEEYDGGSIEPSELFERARLPTLIRARARVQNEYRLFQASLDIRKRRKKLSEEEYQKALEATVRFPSFAVLIDESGKGGPHLIVGAVWLGDGAEAFPLTRKLGQWRQESGFTKELHFKELNADTLPYYQQAVELLLREATTVSFKAVSVPKDGVKRVDEALEELTYQLLRRGVQHEHDTGRAPLPRSLQVWKDQENRGADRILLARLRDRIQQAGRIELDGQLTVDEFEPVESEKSDLLQMADLFSASLNRALNAPGSGHAKDDFSRYMLHRVGMPGGPAGKVTLDGDLTVHLQL